MLKNRTYSVRFFVKRVIITLAALVAVSSASVFLLIYLPLESELEKSLVDNFNQISYIRYTSLQNFTNRGLEGARSLSSRTVIRDAILDYRDGKISLEDLATITQSKYEDGAKALEYLLEAERFIDDDIIARYVVNDYDDRSCTLWDRPEISDEATSAVCLTGDHEYFMIQSPILSQGRVIGYDHLVFDLSEQMSMLQTKKINSKLLYHDEFQDLVSNANTLREDPVSALFYKDGVFCQSFHMDDGTHFITRQSETSLLEPVYRLGKQILFTGISILLVFTLAIYLFVIRFAKNELEDGVYSLRVAVSEANTDPLTGAGSRRLGEELLSVWFERFQKGEPSPTVLLLDIDSLKEINDTQGHSVGDKVIRTVAKVIQKNIRSGDILLRWGGDEFIGIFVGPERESCIPFAKKLLDNVSNLVIECGAGAVNPTISIGISHFKEGDLGFNDVINRADQAMYLSKSRGRNRVHVL